MKYPAFQMTVAAAATAALLVACGGGNDGPAASATVDTPATPAGVVIGGVAATGLALANAPVTVKCSGGDGTTTTDASGAFSVTVSGAALPCLVQVTGTVNGSSVTLHSVSEAGTANGNTTTARANVTPLTELIVARLMGQAPSAAFQSFSATTSITAQQVTAAATAILQAVKDATGVDLGTIDPLKATLVAATTSAPTAGNDYDKLLDALGTKLSVQSLPLVVTQLTANPNGGATALAQALSHAPGCPSAISGRYRTLDLTGGVMAGTIDFKAMKVTFDGHAESPAIHQNPNQACDFSLGGTSFAADASYRFAIGPVGAGAFRTYSGTDIVNGYIFPAQAAQLSAVTGNSWLMAQSGYDAEEALRVNWLTKLTIAADGSVSGCDFQEAQNWGGNCTTEVNAPTLSLVAGTEGSLEVRESGNTAARLWTFRAPDGATTMYGTTVLSDASQQRTHLVATRQTALSLPAAGTKTKVLNFGAAAGANASAFTSNPPVVSQYTIAAGSTANTFVRNGTNGTQTVTNQVILNNAPQNGLRSFQANPAVIQLPLLGSGLTVVMQPAGATSFSHTIAVNLPQ
ncbi:MAG TPA: hypothetical protein VEA40_05030 [Ramlibacter sp.]|nr:hypothetical protein [Ramlibacter sp.]